jgi:hypothetical protein
VVRPAQFRTETRSRKLVKEASERIETVPAKYETVKEKVLVKEASERIEIVPPVYKAVKVRVQSEELQEVVPAVYETVKETRPGQGSQHPPGRSPGRLWRGRGEGPGQTRQPQGHRGARRV